MPKNIAIITAKKISERLPKKNLIDVCGQPMIYYVADIFVACNIFDSIVVSTDCDDIKKVALLHDGVDDVIMRQPEWRSDYFYTPGYDVEQTIRVYEEKTNNQFDFCCILGANSIFWRPSWVRAAIKILEGGEFMRCPLSHVYPKHAFSAGLCFRIGRHGICHSHGFHMAHYGLNIDIDYPEDLELARETMLAIKEGRIDYSLDETIHEDKLRLDLQLKFDSLSRPGTIWP